MTVLLSSADVTSLAQSLLITKGTLARASSRDAALDRFAKLAAPKVGEKAATALRALLAGPVLSFEWAEEKALDVLEGTAKPAPKAKAAKVATHPADRKTPGVRSKFAGKTFALTTKDYANPAREGSRRGKALAVFVAAGEKGATFEEFRANGGELLDFNFALEKGYITEVAGSDLAEAAPLFSAPIPTLLSEVPVPTVDVASLFDLAEEEATGRTSTEAEGNAILRDLLDAVPAPSSDVASLFDLSGLPTAFGPAPTLDLATV